MFYQITSKKKLVGMWPLVSKIAREITRAIDIWAPKSKRLAQGKAARVLLPTFENSHNRWSHAPSLPNRLDSPAQQYLVYIHRLKASLCVQEGRELSESACIWSMYHHSFIFSRETAETSWELLRDKAKDSIHQNNFDCYISHVINHWLCTN